MTELENLINFQTHMSSVEEHYSEVENLEKEIRKNKGKAYSLWPNLLWLLKKLTFAIVLIGLVNFITLKIYNVPLETYASGTVASIIYRITNPIFIYGFIIYILAYIFFFIVEKKENRRRGKYIETLKSLQNKRKEHIENILKKYKEYENPPVKLNESAPEYLQALIELVNDETDIKTAKKIIKRRKLKWIF